MLCCIPLAAVIFGGVGVTAFVPSQRLALIRPRPAPCDPTFARDRYVLPPLFNVLLDQFTSSMVDEVSKLDTGTEDDTMTREDLRLLRGFLRRIASGEIGAQDIFDIFHHATEQEGSQPTLPDLDDDSSTHIEKQGKQLIQFLLGVIELYEDKIDGVYENLNYATYPHHGEFPEVSLAEMMKMMDGVPPLEYFFSKKKFFRLTKRLINVLIGLSITGKRVAKATTAAEKYREVFTKSTINFVPNPLNFVPLPEHTFKHWTEDKEFSRQFLDGVNPLMIRVVKDVKTDLSQEIIDFFKVHDEVDLGVLAQEKRLLLVSYDDLASLKLNPHQAYPEVYFPNVTQDSARYFTAPRAVFQLSKDRKEINVLAIQLDRDVGAEVYSPNPAITDPNTWLFAKVTVKTADAQMHEWVSHLGKTHLTIEPHIIAIHNTLKKKGHPLFTFFQPLVRDTLFLGFAARATLAHFGPNSFGDVCTSVGVGQFLQLIKMYWQRYDFFESSALDKELASRGFDKDIDIPCYHYREDGLKLWNAYGRFAMDFLNEIYKTDGDVANDAVLQEWAKETTDKDKAAVPGFPTSFSDKATLARVMQTLFWVTSGLHAAVNFPQYEYYAYIANHPLGIRKSMEQFKQSRERDRNWMFNEAFPTMDVVKLSILVARGLTLPSSFCIDNLSDNFSKVGTNAYKIFRKELQTIGDAIDKRNAEGKKKGFVPYPYLHPSKVPAAIDI